MFISNLEEVVSTLRSKLPDYLMKLGITKDHKKSFCCIVHDEKNPSMHLNPKTDNQTAHCFSCGATVDVFKACSLIEGLPSDGPEWITETIPHLAKTLGVDISIGAPSSADIIRARYYALARDIADIISHPQNTAISYMEQRNWVNEFEDCYVIDYPTLMAELGKRGWSQEDINSSGMISLLTKHRTYMPIVGTNKVTWIVNDSHGRPVAFISRNLGDDGPKYIHSAESPVFQKKELLLGLDAAIKVARVQGLYVVEGPGDRAQFLRLGKINCASICGVALTENHFTALKTLGIRDIHLCLDWDEAGIKAVEQIAALITQHEITGFNIYVVNAPAGVKDPDEFLCKQTAWPGLDSIPLFQWLIGRTDLKDMDSIYSKLIPAIAAVPVAIKRDAMANELAMASGLNYAAILLDVDRIRNRAREERLERIEAAADKYKQLVVDDPDNISAALATHEKDIDYIEAEYNRNSIGANYQLSRFDALQDIKKSSVDQSEFKFGVYTLLGQALGGGMPYTSGTLSYWGGRANAAKTATVHAIGLDVAIHDPDAIVVIHSTDDSYAIIEPRLVTNAAFLLSGKQKLTVGEAASPLKGFRSAETSSMYNNALLLMRGLIGEERLVIIDSEDGSTLTTLARTLKYLRNKYPTKKILCICDNTYNYSDWAGLEQTARMSMISTQQKLLAIKYRCHIAATVEYRKNMPTDTNKMKLPVNDDIADARALMYRANIIVHVYNDLNDRTADFAEIFWVDPSDPGVKKPRLTLLFGKNKVSSFKDKLIIDLDPDTVTLRQKSRKDVEDEWSHTFSTDTGLVMNTEYSGD